LPEVKPIRVLLVDDEPLANAGLRALLAGQPDLTIVAESLSGQDAVQRIKSLRPDLVFLDVQMPRLDGFEVLREAMRQMPDGTIPHVVFVTAYDQFAVKAFEVQALDYLLKPVDEARLRETLRRVRRTGNGVRHPGVARVTRGAAGPRRLHADPSIRHRESQPGDRAPAPGHSGHHRAAGRRIAAAGESKPPGPPHHATGTPVIGRVSMTSSTLSRAGVPLPR